MSIVNTIVGIALLLVGDALGIWFAYITKIRDLREQKAQLQERVDMLEELISLCEDKKDITKGDNE